MLAHGAQNVDRICDQQGADMTIVATLSTMYSCPACGVPIPLFNSRCLTCTREQWGASWVARLESKQLTPLHVVVLQDADEYRLVRDVYDATDGVFVSFGTWRGCTFN
ncbi:Aste57867_1676 [Aphanomyces stellatus]|uniref:Aste57867_1676 protein n=1 Tax=Aphanomyces stellatus TaxID=120398 RepID=A0A485K5P1_9STRA|nr:hypothetical protein As57867_001674 [Aphanomyces stellatus]VFT78887.1 Aste57867_1676 [Aphanomyces stellatus]